MSWSKASLKERRALAWLGKRGVARNVVSPYRRSLVIAGKLGSLHDRLGDLMAQSLGLGFFDQETLAMIASNNEHNLQTPVQVIRQLGQDGGGVIMNSGAEYILNSDNALRIQCVAHRDLRVQRIAQQMGLSMSAAERYIDVHDQRTKALRDKMNVSQLGDDDVYDVVISTSQFSIDQAASIIVRAYRALDGDRRGMPVKVLRRVPQSQTAEQNVYAWIKRKDR